MTLKESHEKQHIYNIRLIKLRILNPFCVRNELHIQLRN